MNESEPRAKEQGMSIEDAKTEIKMIRQEIYMKGANDSEFDQINDILKKMEQGKYLPEQAVQEARKISESKMEYH
jgi:uncharacterized membrane protein YjjP (DUF1212 family)